MSLATCEGALRASQINSRVELFFIETENFFMEESSTAGVSDSFVQPVRRAKMLLSRLYSILIFLSS